MSKVYYYRCSTGNPEGIDWTMSLENDFLFSNEQFQNICEAALVEAFKKLHKERGCVFTHSISPEDVLPFFESRGFRRLEFSAVYHLEPYWHDGGIKSEELREWVNKRYEEEG